MEFRISDAFSLIRFSSILPFKKVNIYQSPHHPHQIVQIFRISKSPLLFNNWHFTLSYPRSCRRSNGI